MARPTDDTITVAAHMRTRETLELLAEECAELAQAALKVVRTLKGSKNPTPMTHEQACALLEEEAGDVQMVLDLLGLCAGDTTGNPKWARWAQRIREAGA